MKIRANRSLLQGAMSIFHVDLEAISEVTDLDGNRVKFSYFRLIKKKYLIVYGDHETVDITSN